MDKSTLIPLVLLCALLGCTDTADTTADQAAATRATPESSANPPGSEQPAAPKPTCGIDAGTNLTADGIGPLRVGASVADVHSKCDVVRDGTARDLEGMPERSIAVDLLRDTVEAVVVDDRAWRIHVDGPAFRTADGLGVGTTVAELRKERGARVLAGEGSMFITLADRCGLSFKLGGVEFGPARPVSELPANARVMEVLAFGCGSTRP